MSKSRTIHLAAFNIVTHPHSPKSYEQLFFAAKELRQMIKIWGDTHALLRSAYKLEEYKTPIITGEIFTFLEIDLNQPWFDILKGEEATDKQTHEVKIPENLRPHLKRIRYVFFPDSHIFVYTRDDSANGRISPKSMGELLASLLNDNRILANAAFQAVDVRLVQDSKSLDWIFENLRVERLDITIRKPNGDTGGDAEESVEKELEEQNLEEYFVSQKAEKGKAIKPNARTRRLLNEATINGQVEAKGLDKDDITQTKNTSAHPLVEPFVFEAKRPYIEFIVESGKALVEKIRKAQKGLVEKIANRDKKPKSDQE